MLPFCRFGHKHAQQKRKQSRKGTGAQHPAPASAVHARAQRLDTLDKHCRQHVANVGRRPNHPGQDGPAAGRPTFHDQRHSQRPFSPHAQRRQETQPRYLLCVLGQTAQARKQGIGQHAKHHPPYAPYPIAQPAKKPTSQRSAKQKCSRDAAVPQADRPVDSLGQQYPLRLILRGSGLRLLAAEAKHLDERRPGHERENPHLETIKQPAQERGDQCQPSGAGCPSENISRHQESDMDSDNPI